MYSPSIFFLMIRRPPRSTRTDTPFPTRRSSDLFGGQADAQRMLVEFAVVQRNAYRYALHHLDPVAGGVLRRQQREHTAGAGAEADHLAVEFGIAAVDVGDDLRRLADADVARSEERRVGKECGCTCSARWSRAH